MTTAATMAADRFLGRKVLSSVRLVRWENKVARAIDAALEPHRQHALSTIRTTTASVSHPDPFNLDAWDHSVDSEVRSVIEDVLLDASENSVRFLALSPTLRAKVLGALDVDSQAATFIDRIKSIGPLIADRLRQELNAGLSAGESISKLQERVETAMDVGESRGETIARTEVHGAAMQAGHETAGALDASGTPLRKVWLATLDDRVRDAHADADGQEVGYDEPFNVDGEDLDYPGDPSGSAENVANCRCDVLYDTAEGLSAVADQDEAELEEAG